MRFRASPRAEKEQWRMAFQVDPSRVAAMIEGRPITVDDLRLLVDLLNGITSSLTGSGSADPIVSLQQVGRFLVRLEAGPKHTQRKYKPEFLAAYEARKEASRSGKTITSERLAQEFMAPAYERNPASAIRSMQQAMKRIEADERRLAAQLAQQSAAARRTKK
jgi:hypothetical protein